MKNYIIPGLYEHHKLLFTLIKLLKEHPEYFLEETNIGAVYGNFQFCIWDGGRTFGNYKHSSKEEILKIKTVYNDTYNIPMRFIFTNSQLKEEHLHDRFCNMVLQLCENELNEIVVNSPLLENYIRTNYPKYKIISSTTKCLTRPSDFKNEINNTNYYMVCLDYNLNKNKELLNSLTKEEKSRCEFLVNAICPSGCPSRKEHYKLNSLFYLSYGKRYRTKTCGIKYSNLFPHKEGYQNNLTPEECVEYSKNDFVNFKLEGRTFNDLTLAENIVHYMVKPEYQLYVLHSIMNILK